MEFYTVQNCAIQRCPFEWRHLLPTSDVDRRECLVCDRMIRLAHSAPELLELVKEGECVAMETDTGTMVGLLRTGIEPPEHYDPNLQSALRRYKAGVHSSGDLRTLFLRYLEGDMRKVAIDFYKKFIAQGNIPDYEMTLAASRRGISLPGQDEAT